MVCFFSFALAFALHCVAQAIGWALRNHARVEADAVLEFVAEHSERLSALSKREALKHIGPKQAAALTAASTQAKQRASTRASARTGKGTGKGKREGGAARATAHATKKNKTRCKQQQEEL